MPDAPTLPPPERPRRTWRRVRRPALVVVAVVLAVGAEVAIRAGEPRTVDPTGVDTLAIPWDAPAPDEFVASVDHAWWPMAPGDTWLWEEPSGGSRTRWTVGAGPEVAGIATTSLDLGDRVLDLAEDREGHVWVLAVRAGDDASTPTWSVAEGAPAGLLLPAEPRRGDGHALAAPEGTATETVEVGERSEEPVEVPAGSFGDTLTVDLATPPGQEQVGTSDRIVLARGVGPVRTSSLADGVRLLVQRPRG